MPRHWFWAAAAIAATAGCLRAADAPWPTLQRDNQRSAFTDETIPGPYERKWFRDFHEELIPTRTQAVLAEGKCFVGTLAGRMIALDAADGRTAWEFRAGGPIGHTACYHDGRVIFGADERFDRGVLYAVGAADGRLAWRYPAPAGVWAAPAVAAGPGGGAARAYVGDRGGTFHAVDAGSGRPLWTFRAGGTILTPASVSADGGQIVLAAEDMHVYCLDAAGKLLWKSPKLGGLSLRDHAPVLWKGLAIVQSNPAISFHHAQGNSPELVTRIQKALPMEDGDQVLLDKRGSYILKPTPRRERAEREGIREFLARTPAERTFYALSLADGREPWVAPILYTAGLHNPPTPPTFNPQTGELFVLFPTALNAWHRGVPGGGIAPGRLDRDSGDVRRIDPPGKTWGLSHAFIQPADETQTLSLMGDVLLLTHQGSVNLLDLRGHKLSSACSQRDSYGGIFGPVYWGGYSKEARAAQAKARAEGCLLDMPNEWHGPDRSAVAIGYGRFFWVVGSQVVCLGGPAAPRTESGGTKPPPPIRRKHVPLVGGGNVTHGGAGGFDKSVPSQPIPPDVLARFIEPPPAAARPADSPLVRELRARLDTQVSELLDGWPWAPLIVELGISHEEVHFLRTAQTMQALALALPHLSPPVRQRAVKLLDDLLAAGAPLEASVQAEGKRREPYTPGKTMLAAMNDAAGKARQEDAFDDLYALWAVAHYADRWQGVLAKTGAVEKLWRAHAARPFAFDHDDMTRDAAELLNRDIAGALGCVRILRRAGRSEETKKAEARLAQMLAVRVHHERADSRLVRATITSRGPSAHAAKAPRYVGLVPELSALLAGQTGPALRRHVEALDRELPIWHQAWAERLIGGENYITPPHLSRGLFAVLADALGADGETLARRLDQPWCRADLYYIEKLTALLRAGR